MAKRYVSAVQRPEDKRASACDGKAVFATYVAAAGMAKKQARRHDRVKKFMAYRCDHCRRYHVGQNRQRRGRPKLIEPLSEIDLEDL